LYGNYSMPELLGTKPGLFNADSSVAGSYNGAPAAGVQCFCQVRWQTNDNQVSGANTGALIRLRALVSFESRVDTPLLDN